MGPTEWTCPNFSDLAFYKEELQVVSISLTHTSQVKNYDVPEVQRMGSCNDMQVTKLDLELGAVAHKPL